jgi:hypothetical protein
MGNTQLDKVKADQDIPENAANLGGVSNTTAVAGVTNYYMTNRLTFFEELVIAITDGFAANSARLNGTDQEFAARACALARAIAYERNKYGNV